MNKSMFNTITTTPINHNRQNTFPLCCTASDLNDIRHAICSIAYLLCIFLLCNWIENIARNNCLRLSSLTVFHVRGSITSTCTHTAWYGCNNCLPHWRRMTQICVSKLTIIGSDNGLSPRRHQAIIWTNAGILLIGPLGTNFSEILIELNTFQFKKMHLQMPSGKWRPFCLGLNVLINIYDHHTILLMRLLKTGGIKMFKKNIKLVYLLVLEVVNSVWPVWLLKKVALYFVWIHIMTILRQGTWWQIVWTGFVKTYKVLAYWM